jgi:hypothetical protein
VVFGAKRAGLARRFDGQHRFQVALQRGMERLLGQRQRQRRSRAMACAFTCAAVQTVVRQQVKDQAECELISWADLARRARERLRRLQAHQARQRVRRIAVRHQPDALESHVQLRAVAHWNPSRCSDATLSS